MAPLNRIADRYQAVLQVNKTAITRSTLSGMFRGFCAATCRVITFDRAGLMLYDAAANSLTVAALHGTAPHSFFHIGVALDPEQSPHGLSFRHQQTVIRSDISKEAEFEIEHLTLSEGLHSYCGVPLVVRGVSLGVMTFLSFRKKQYSERHAKFLENLADQVALGISSLAPRCLTHESSRLVCPRCIASAGGLRTIAKYKDQLATWGKQGGRGRKKAAD